MIERILSGLMTLGDIFDRSRDPELEEFRHHQRVAIVASAVAAVTLLMALLIGPSESEALGHYNAMVAAIQWPVAVGLLGICFVACLRAMWAAYCLSKYENGFQ